MPKRSNSSDTTTVLMESSSFKSSKTNKSSEMAQSDIMDNDMGEFEDAFEDEIEDEEVVEYASDSDQERARMEMEEENVDEKERVYIPGQPLKEGEVLDFDPSAYRMLHSMNVEWPCLSFSILRDELGNDRENVRCYNWCN
jgi:ribosome assembly protein RRB1